jgi:hypothetical protein
MVAAFAAVIVVARSGSEPTHFEQRGTDASLRVPLELGAPSVRLRERPTTAPASATTPAPAEAPEPTITPALVLATSRPPLAERRGAGVVVGSTSQAIATRVG